MDQTGIIEQLKRGDKTFYAEVVRKCETQVYNTALGIVQNAEDAEDLTQDVFVTLYENIKDFREESALSTWLYRVTIRKALDHEKKKNREKNGGLLKKIFSIKPADEPVNFNHPGVLLDNKENAAVLFKAVKKLSPNQQVAFTLHKLEGLSYQQISEIMDTSLFSVESLLTRAKNNLKNILKEFYHEHFKQ